MKTNEEIALENLLIARKILSKHRITLWLEAGTLLLAYRDKKIDDTDVDISIKGKDIPKVLQLLQEFYNEGFTTYEIYKHPSGLGTQLSLRRSGVKLDVWGKWIKGDRTWWFSYNYGASDTSKIFIPHHVDAKHVLTLDKLKVFGMTWNIPHDTEGYLKAVYGDWRIPDHNWVWWSDPLCIDFDWRIE